MSAPFIIYGLPRSRTAWLSMFLTYKDWTCHHEKMMHMRRIGDFKELMSAPNTGAAETGACYGRCLMKWFAPNLKEVVILRPVEEVMESLMKIDMEGTFTFDRQKLQKLIEKGRRALDKIAKDPKVLVIEYADLEKEETCKRLFEFCLPYQFDREWWKYMDQKIITINFPLLAIYRTQHKSLIDGYKNVCKRELFQLARLGNISLREAG